jgi:7-cyano-7-deazaguanine synthase
MRNQDLQNALSNKVVVTWSGGPDSTGLIFLLLQKYDCEVYPIFIDRKQSNIKYERDSVQHYTQIFKCMSKKFKTPLSVSIISPPKEIKDNFHNKDAVYAMRNSDIINQGVRFAFEINATVVLLATFEEENQFGDGSRAYLYAKTTEVNNAMNVTEFHIFSPFHHDEFPQKKEDLIKICNASNFDLTRTRSCYDEFSKHCGRCQSCRNRARAFKAADVQDLTEYANDPWNELD